MIEFTQLGKVYLMICTWYDSIIGVLDTKTQDLVVKAQLQESKLNRDMCLVQTIDSSFAIAIAKGFVIIKYDKEDLSMG